MSDGPDPRELRRRAEIAREVALAGGAFALDRFDGGLEVETKADGTPVTAADRGAEEVMREQIVRLCPEDGIVGEEHGSVDGSNAWRWVLDPIDGTKSFVRGVPLWSTLVGILHEGRPVVGVIHLPALGETLDAFSGGGCRRNGAAARVSAVDRIEDGLVCQSDVWADHAGLLELDRKAAVARTWGDAYGYFLVAVGRAEAMVDPVVGLWDVAAVQPVLEEAGGRFTDFVGNARPDGGSGLGTNGIVHDEVLSILRS